jgi:hypothetical protein
MGGPLVSEDTRPAGLHLTLWLEEEAQSLGQVGSGVLARRRWK